MFKRSILFICLTFLLVGCGASSNTAGTPNQNPTNPASNSFTGIWVSNKGVFEVTEENNAFTGKYLGISPVTGVPSREDLTLKNVSGDRIGNEIYLRTGGGLVRETTYYGEYTTKDIISLTIPSSNPTPIIYKRTHTNVNLDVAGTWRMKETTRVTGVPDDIVMIIQQTGKKLTGTVSLTYQGETQEKPIEATLVGNFIPSLGKLKEDGNFSMYVSLRVDNSLYKSWITLVKN